MDEPMEVSATRLFDAADMVLAMIESHGGAMRLLDLAMAPLADSTADGTVLTQTELDEAIKLLLRLGLIEPSNRSDSA